VFGVSFEAVHDEIDSWCFLAAISKFCFGGGIDEPTEDYLLGRPKVISLEQLLDRNGLFPTIIHFVIGSEN